MSIFSRKEPPLPEAKENPRLKLALAIVTDQKQFANLYGAGGPRRVREQWPVLADYDVQLLRNHWGLASFKHYPAVRKPVKLVTPTVAGIDPDEPSEAVIDRLANRVAEILLERLLK